MEKYPKSDLKFKVLKNRNNMDYPTLEELLFNIQHDLALKNVQVEMDIENDAPWLQNLVEPTTTTATITANNNRIIELLGECLDIQKQTMSLTSK